MKIVMLLIVLSCVAIGGGQQSGTAPSPNQEQFYATRNNALFICSEGCSDEGFISVSSATGRIDRLRNSEYAGLEKLRKAVKDEELRIAEAHGIYTNPCDGVSFYGNQLAMNDGCFRSMDFPGRPSDTYEFRGQWLLINVPSPGGVR